MSKEQYLIEHFNAILPFNPKSWLLCQQLATLEAVTLMEAYASRPAGQHLIPQHMRHQYEAKGGPNNTQKRGNYAGKGRYAEREMNRIAPESIRADSSKDAIPTLSMKTSLTRSTSTKCFICGKYGHCECQCPHMGCKWVQALPGGGGRR